ncbi:hypothetical protein Bpfe_001887 [Biomphalaria pfeifferi]|uniref:Uncharacterized protein n=1 Tax=Biomphalaria pfeifferi TaxID=112525 RepID=A0AAD8C9U8_BIOPF|nr:hypothetical protein Bpfe_001887 [Biomphalaria pfeifferi]
MKMFISEKNHGMNCLDVSLAGLRLVSRVRSLSAQTTKRSQSSQAANHLRQPFISGSQSSKAANQLRQPIISSSHSSQAANYLRQPIISSSQSSQAANHLKQPISKPNNFKQPII